MRLLGRWNWWVPARIERFMTERLPIRDADIEGAR
jgi:hypothetical protein